MYIKAQGFISGAYLKEALLKIAGSCAQTATIGFKEQQNIIQVVGEALENPTKVLRGTVSNKNVQCLVKAVQLPDDAGKNRMVLVLEPEK